MFIGAEGGDTWSVCNCWCSNVQKAINDQKRVIKILNQLLEQVRTDGFITMEQIVEKGLRQGASATTQRAQGFVELGKCVEVTVKQFEKDNSSWWDYLYNRRGLQTGVEVYANRIQAPWLEEEIRRSTGLLGRFEILERLCRKDNGK